MDKTKLFSSPAPSVARQYVVAGSLHPRPSRAGERPKAMISKGVSPALEGRGWSPDVRRDEGAGEKCRRFSKGVFALLPLCLLLLISPLSAIHQSGIGHETAFPRTITPNGDGINDTAFFFFENKTGAPVKGQVFGLQGGKIADLKESTLLIQDYSVMTWDGKDSSGSAVTAGLYLYKVDIGDRKFTGTLAVAR